MLATDLGPELDEVRPHFPVDFNIISPTLCLRLPSFRFPLYYPYEIYKYVTHLPCMLHINLFDNRNNVCRRVNLRLSSAFRSILPLSSNILDTPPPPPPVYVLSSARKANVRIFLLTFAPTTYTLNQGCTSFSNN
jgi:hypothetical protein